MKQRKKSHKTERSLLWPLLVAFGQILTAWRAGRNYQSLPEVLPTNRLVTTFW